MPSSGSKTFKYDIVASLVVFLVALPLSLGIALASGAPMATGLISAMCGGIIVGLLAGSPLMVSGPAAGLTVICFQIAQSNGLQFLFLSVMVAGLVQIFLGLLRFGNFFNLVPKFVLHGMLAAIGIIILMGQLHVFMGQKMPTSFVSAVSTLPTAFSVALQETRGALLCGLLCFAIIQLWPKVFPKLSMIPGALPATVLGTVVSLFTEQRRIGEVNIGSYITNYFQNFDLNYVQQNFISIFGIALSVAIVASAESLLTARATDLLAADKGLKPAPSNLNKELLAQGSGNFVSGLLGSLPVTGVIVRSAANVEAGGRTRLSTVLHGVWILVFVGVFSMVLEKIPLSALAAILVHTGLKLSNIRGLIREFQVSKKDGTVWLVTLLSILFTNLLNGLGIGIGLYIVLNFSEFLKLLLKAIQEWKHSFSPRRRA